MVTPTGFSLSTSREKADRQEAAIQNALAAIRLFQTGGLGSTDAALAAVVALLQRLVRASANHRSFAVSVIRVVTVDEPVQGPDEAIPDGVTVTIRLRPQSGATVTGYVASSRFNALDSANRIALEEASSAELDVTNLKAIWVNADTAAALFECIYERD